MQALQGFALIVIMHLAKAAALFLAIPGNAWKEPCAHSENSESCVIPFCSETE